MKRSRILICSILAVVLSSGNDCRAQATVIKSGVYSFTGTTASAFYNYAPTVSLDQFVAGSSRLDLRFSPSFSFRQVRYNSNLHTLMMIPVLVTAFYHLPNPGSRLSPSLGMGAGMIWKSDYNKEYEKTHHAIPYGYHITGRLNYILRNGRHCVFDMTYNLMMYTGTEEVNLSGVLLTVGVSLTKTVVTNYCGLRN